MAFASLVGTPSGLEAHVSSEGILVVDCDEGGLADIEASGLRDRSGAAAIIMSSHCIAGDREAVIGVTVV